MPTRVVSRWPIGNLLCPSPSTAALPSPYTEQSFQRRLGKMTGSGGDKDEKKTYGQRKGQGKVKGQGQGKEQGEEKGRGQEQEQEKRKRKGQGQYKILNQ